MVGQLLILQLVAGYGVACLCFLLGIPLGGWQYWLSVALAVGLGFRSSRWDGLWVIGLNALVFVLTLFTFTYIHCDASTCHVPMARFIQEGWNPVREPTFEAVAAHFAAYGVTEAQDRLLDFHVFHLIADPKFVQILAAQMQAGCRLFTAAGYPLWMLFIALALTAARVAREVFGSGRRAAVVLATLLCCNVELTYGSFRGQVDFVTYAAAVLAGLSLLLWQGGRRRADLVAFFASLAIASVSKFNGLCTSLLFLGLAGAIGWKARDMRRGLLLFCAAMLVLGILPYGTAAWWFGSPLYPAHTFRADVPLPELTGDFEECNAAAAQMGYVARMVYAYVSQPLAVWGTRLWYGDMSLAPAWRKAWLTCGYGFVGCVLLWSGLAVGCRVRRRAVKAVIVILFLSFFMIPTKYIGFPRYVAQVHAAVALSWFAFALQAEGRIGTIARRLCAGGALVLAGIAGFHFLGQLHIERTVQRNIARMKRAGEPYTLRTKDPWLLHQETWAYILRDRCALEGYDLQIDGKGRPLSMDFQMAMEGPGLHTVYGVQPKRLFYPWPGPLWQHPAIR